MAGALQDRRRSESEALVLRAEFAVTEGREADARKLFAEAAALEQAVAEEVNEASPRVRSVLAISAVALWYKAEDLEAAKRVAYRFLASDGLTPQGRSDLERLVERCSREAELREITKDQDMVPVDVKLRGGRVGFGIAPAATARRRRDAVTNLLIRSADLEAHLAYRERGGSELVADEEVQLFEVPPIAASYGLRFYVTNGQQKSHVPGRVEPRKVVERFLALATAAAEGPEALRAQLPDPKYSAAFIAGFGEIAPDGKDVEEVACSTPSWRLPSAPRQVFRAEHQAALRRAPAGVDDDRPLKDGESALVGRLTGFRMFGPDAWLELALPEGGAPVMVFLVHEKRKQTVAKVSDLMNQNVEVIATPPRPPRRRHFLARIKPL